MNTYLEKFNDTIENTFYAKLPENEQTFIKEKSLQLKFSYQELKQIIDIARDLSMWHEKNILEIFPDHNQKKVVFTRLRKAYEDIRDKPNSYKNFELKNIPQEQKYTFTTETKEGFGLGLCPVASEKTRCCNLLTLDAVESCGFDCSYCSIQSFYNQNTITFDSGFADKLLNLNLDQNKTYHIGTGQSSDSLMWGNREGILDSLFRFARENPNVILEFKTKSDNIKHFLENDVPTNILCTYSLNTQTIIDNEEHLTASLNKRVKAARKLADKGVKVGFHFHPIVEYENYLEEYKEVYDKLINEFKVGEVALISFGTLTFIKPVIKQLREREFRTKITQIPHVNASGKTSYPDATKVEMFKHAYESFKPWHKDVFFYLCMEEHSMWAKTFGYEYSTNNDFERAMLASYANKLDMEFLL
ncbi:MAG: spore photoproduct lyase [Sulfurimonas sp.]|jgi:spore photoproduct lyase|uniref:SPL family radical SAM protein n=1 Tax=Sulfurimonas sp. TaxID=2022749 RepID=UPI0039E55BCE